MGKKILSAISDFSKKLKQFENSTNDFRIQQESENSRLQEIINLSDEERKAFILGEYKVFADAVTKDIEEDENSLLLAFETFLKAAVINAGDKTGAIGLVDLRIKCPVCNKTEYRSSEKFSFLRIWFLQTKKDCAYVPQISKTLSGKYCLEFIPKDEWKPSAFEKEILQVIGSN